MAPITRQRFLKKLDKLRHDTDAGTLKEQDYDRRLARIIRELRERGLGRRSGERHGGARGRARAGSHRGPGGGAPPKPNWG
jgi:hypothetical protein